MNTDALKSSWEIVAKSGHEVPLYFYSHLFLSHPELRPMFPVSMAGQRDKLVGALGRVVSNVDALDDVTGYLAQLGRDHRRFSVIAEHYDAVGASLLATLQHFAGAHWSDELATDWAAAYGVIAQVMVQAAEAAEKDTPPYWEGEVLANHRPTIEVSVLQVRPTQPLAFQPGQSMAVEIPHRPRQWRYLSPANAPRPDGTLEFHVQLVPGGQVSGQILRAVTAGDVVRIGAPVGDALTLPDHETRPLLMVAGGTGLAPLRSLLEGLDRRWRAHGTVPHVHLFHGARARWGLYEEQRLRALQATRPWFTYTGVTSEETNADGPTGTVGDVAADHGHWGGRLVLLCGSGPMIAHTVNRLVAAGVPRGDIRHEHFDTSDVSASTTKGPGDEQ